MTAQAARGYPATPAGWTRHQRDIEHADMAKRGHAMKWKPGHGRRWMRGKPGWTGQCGKCGDVVIEADATPDTAFVYHGDHEGKRAGPRKCRRRPGWWPQ